MVKRKTITGFVCGLIGSLFSLFWGFVFAITGNFGSLIGAAANNASATGTFNVFYLLGWIAFIGGIFGIVGAAMCFKKARTGAIWLGLATVMSGSLLVYLFSQVVMAAGPTMILTWVIVFLLPVILLAVATVFGFIAKPVEVAQNNTAYAQNNNQQVQQPKVSSMEEKLQNLKDMYDKGLINEEEYNEARKNVISKGM